MELLYNGENKGTVFENLPTGEPLYFIARVCGHDGQCGMMILDEVDDFEAERLRVINPDDGMDYEEEE